MPKKVVVVGAGLAGMACAARLAHAGYEVRLLEKNSRQGGRLDQHEALGFRWDTDGASLTMPFVVRHFFQDLKCDLEDYLELMPLQPCCRFFFQDGQTVRTWSDLQNMTIEIARREKDHGERFNRFHKHTQGLFELSAGFLFPGANSRSSSAAGRWKNLPKVLGFSSMEGRARHFFRNPQIARIFTRHALELGGSPSQISGAFLAVAYPEIAFGNWYVRGGMRRLVEAMERLEREKGVQVSLNAEVDGIKTDDGRRVTGVTIKNGEEIACDAVVVTSDPLDAWESLLRFPGKDRQHRKWTSSPLSFSHFTVILGVNKSFQKLEHENVFFPAEEQQEYDDLLKKRVAPKDPTLQVWVSSRSDPTQAPAGHDNIVIRAHVPAIQPNFSWKENQESYANHLIHLLENRGVFPLLQHVIYRHVISPLDTADRYFIHHGVASGQALTSISAYKRRPSSRAPGVRGLYLAGASVRPGGPLPLVLLSARNAALTLQRDLPA
ncbi:MAG: phytoene desaturase [Verrucomicrobiae bacterium]|nr:phytoene desaturase [Verrucomicrobiae bacterium]